MYKIYTAVAVITLLAFVSCAGSNDKEYTDKSIIPPGSEKNTTGSEGLNSTTENTAVLPGNTPTIPGLNQVNVSPQNNSINLNPQNNVVTTIPQTVAPVTGGKLNPAHGQPGHRCDISVGGSLDGKPAPAQPAAVKTQPAQPTVTTTEVPNTNKTAPGMNPPHGETGHRCDIAVGSPLNSKPAPPASVVSTTPPTTTTVTSTAQPAAQKTAPGMNPAHGEPGHRCDIAVGASLDSKPTATTNAAPAKTATPPPLLTPVKSGGNKN